MVDFFLSMESEIPDISFRSACVVLYLALKPNWASFRISQLSKNVSNLLLKFFSRILETWGSNYGHRPIINEDIFVSIFIQWDDHCNFLFFFRKDACFQGKAAYMGHRNFNWRKNFLQHWHRDVMIVLGVFFKLLSMILLHSLTQVLSALSFDLYSEYISKVIYLLFQFSQLV